MTNLFRITNNNGQEQKEIITITPDNTYYRIYNSYLKNLYFTDIEENEDFIPLARHNEIIMILQSDEDDPIEAEEVFDCMMDYFHKIV